LAEPHTPAAEAFTARRSVGYLVRRAAQLINLRAERLFEGRELTLAQWISLCLVGNRLASTPSAVAGHLGHNTGATTRLLDQLEERGLLTRARETDDRRVVTLDLTGDGATAVAGLRPLMTSSWNEALDGFDPDEIETLTNLLARLVTRLEELRR
jgi:DNA-binding MarR family transcriptional regulator